MQLTGMDLILYDLTKGDLTKLAALKKEKVDTIYLYAYRNKLDQLNSILDAIAFAEEREQK